MKETRSDRREIAHAHVSGNGLAGFGFGAVRTVQVRSKCLCRRQ